MTQSDLTTSNQHFNETITYRVVLRGIGPGMDATAVKSKLATLFAASIEQVEQLLASPAFVIKKSLPLDTASKYKKAIESAGGLCDVERELEEPLILQVDLPVHAVSLQKTAQPSTEATSVIAQGLISSPVSARPEATTAIAPKLDYVQPAEMPAMPIVQNVWWHARGNQTVGPMTLSQLCHALQTGVFTTAELVWKEGWPEWVVASSVEELFTPVPVQPVPPAANTTPGMQSELTGAKGDSMQQVRSQLNFIKLNITSEQALWGVRISFGLFLLSCLLPWTTITPGKLSSDSGSINGFMEKAIFAMIPLVFALSPMTKKKPVELHMVFINMGIAFALLAFNNIFHRSTWRNGFGDLGSVLGSGFYLGLVSMLAVSVFGIAWSLHTTNTKLY